MSDDSGPRPRRLAVATKRDRVTHAGAPLLEIEPEVASPVSWPRPGEELSRESTALSREVSDRAVSTAARRSPLTFAPPQLKVPPAVTDFIRSLPRLKVSPLLVSFIGCVLVPAFAATIYFAFIASDQPAAEARFAVRQVEIESSDRTESASTESSSAGGMNIPSANLSFTATGQNAYVVTSYIRSRAIIDDLNAKLNVGDIFRRPEADFWARLKRNATVDELTEYWNSMVEKRASRSSEP
jgi:capsular polysaccharide transport system permease protein